VAATDFTPIASAAGGALIGVSAVMLMLLSGRIAGISGIVGRLLPPYRGGGIAEALVFVAGLIAAPVLYTLITGAPVVQTVSGNIGLMIAAGLLVGFGAGLGGGCTSGHGVCGLARLSPRSLAATLTFMATGLVTVFVLRHVLGA
jgi:uncharacterized membrane protein YedE/YeeE